MNNPNYNSTGMGRRRQLRRRFWIGVASSVVVLFVVYLAVSMQSAGLRNPAWTTGYLLMGCLLFLTAYNFRKKIHHLATFGSSKMWMQLHIYIAFVSIGIFVMHVGLHIPNGNFERLLAALYVIVAGSGVFGLYSTRTIPQKLTALKNEVSFEQIPKLRQQMKERVRHLVLESAKSTDVIARFYANKLVHFFERPRSLAYQVSPSLRRSRQLVTEVEGLDRYLSDDQRKSSRQLTRLIRDKEDLDYHWALQGRLKIWLFVHIGLTYGLLISAILHGVMAHSFGGGLR